MASATGPRKRLTDTVPVYSGAEWGFAGTRAGMSTFQLTMFRRIMKMGQPLVFRHGGAYGAEQTAHAIWREECKDATAEVWPSEHKRAMLFMGHPQTHVKPVMASAHRNVEIVKRSTFLIATPNTEIEESRSSTWQVIQEGLKVDRDILIIWPFTKRLTLFQNKTLYRITYIG